jgi:hypothetical protein
MSCCVHLTQQHTATHPHRCGMQTSRLNRPAEYGESGGPDSCTVRRAALSPSLGHALMPVGVGWLVGWVGGWCCV